MADAAIDKKSREQQSTDQKGSLHLNSSSK
jgi:hypothetical protein